VTANQDDRDEDARFEALLEQSSLGAPGARQLRERVPLARKLLVAWDVQGLARLSARPADKVQERVAGVLASAFGEAGVAPGSREVYQQGDGGLALLPAGNGADRPRLIISLIDALDSGLRRVNEALAPSARLRLRLALEEGGVYQAGHGPGGPSVAAVSRLVDAANVRNMLEDSSGYLVVVVTDHLYRDILAYAPERTFARAGIPSKEKGSPGPAWAYLPGERAAHVPGTALRAPDPRDRAAWPEASLMGSLTPGDRAALLAAGTRVQFSDHDILVMEGDVGDAVYVLTGGMVKITAGTEAGAAMLAVRSRGDLIGKFAILNGMPRTATVRAVGTVGAVRVTMERLSALTEAHPDALPAITRSVTAKLRSETERRAASRNRSAQERLAQVIYDLATEYGEKSPDGGAVIFLPLTQAELGELAGVAVATTERLLAEFRRDQLVQTGYRKITVRDMASLGDRLVAPGARPTPVIRTDRLEAPVMMVDAVESTSSDQLPWPPVPLSAPRSPRA
jgi:CRP/FNR family transcriptional regulator, cyclic AMP receptor protein